MKEIIDLNVQYLSNHLYNLLVMITMIKGISNENWKIYFIIVVSKILKKDIPSHPHVITYIVIYG